MKFNNNFHKNVQKRRFEKTRITRFRQEKHQDFQGRAHPDEEALCPKRSRGEKSGQAQRIQGK